MPTEITINAQISGMIDEDDLGHVLIERAADLIGDVDYFLTQVVGQNWITDKQNNTYLVGSDGFAKFRIIEVSNDPNVAVLVNAGNLLIHNRVLWAKEYTDIENIWQEINASQIN